MGSSRKGVQQRSREGQGAERGLGGGGSRRRFTDSRRPCRPPPRPSNVFGNAGRRAQADQQPWAVQAFSKGTSRGGAKGASTSPSPPTTSSAHTKVGAGGPPSKTTWPSTCLTCKNQGRPHEHSWRGCKFALANYELFKKSKKGGDPKTTPKHANAPSVPTGRGKGNSRY